MRRLETLVLLGLLASCSGVQQPTTTVASAAPTSPSPGPRGEDAFDDQGLATAQHDLVGRTADDAARAELRLTVDQLRAFIVAVVHALPARELPSGSSESPPPPARFDPPSTLVQQLEAMHECSDGGVAHACAARLGNTLLSRIDALHPPADLENVKYALQATLAALEESRVVIATDIRWRILQSGDDPGAHLAQALTLLLATRQVAQASSIQCACDEAAHIAARLADDLAIGTCSDAYETLLGRDGTVTDGRAGLSALATAGCVPACARAALTASSDDGVTEAAHACRTDATEAMFLPFADASHALGAWMRATATRLEAVTNDPAVREILSARPPLAPGVELPMPPPLFRAGNGNAVELPEVSGDPGAALAMAMASALIWLPPTGDVTVTAAPHFALEAAAANAGARAGAIETLGQLVSDVVHASGNARAPLAIVVDPATRAARVVRALTQIPHGEQNSAEEPLVGIAVRHGIDSGYVPLRVSVVPPTRVYRIGERQVTVVDADRGTNIVALTPPPATGADLLSGAIPDAAPTGPFGLALEADVTGATIARVANALAVHGARADTPLVPGILPAIAESPVLVGTIDAAHATALRTALESHRADGARCMANVPAGTDGVAPRVDLHLVLDARGHVTRSETATDAPRSAPAAQCITTALRRWRLPAPGAAIEVRYPFVLDRP